jgi:hypothetical protein
MKSKFGIEKQQLIPTGKRKSIGKCDVSFGCFEVKNFVGFGSPVRVGL